MKLRCQDDLQLRKCETCGFETHLKVSLKDHLHGNLKVNHNLDNLLADYTCGKCTFHTYSLLLLGGHICPQSSQKKWHQCEQCLYLAADKTSLNKHILSAHPEDTVQPGKPNLRKPQNPVKIDVKSHKCEWCDYSATTGGNLCQHILRKHPEQKINTKSRYLKEWFRCEHCDYETKEKKNFRRHVYLKHTDSAQLKWFRCEQCDFKFKTKSNLQTHVSRLHSKVGRIKCANCDFLATNKDDLKRHVSSKRRDPQHVKWHECEHCGYKSKRKYDVDVHVAGMHPTSGVAEWSDCDQSRGQSDVLAESSTPGVVRGLKCEQCEYTATGQDLRSKLRQHVNLRHTPSELINWISCEKCRFRTRTKQCIELHRLRKHTDSECIEWVECEYCDYKAKTKDNLAKHMKRKHKNPQESQTNSKQKAL